MRIYLASSWKMSNMVLFWADTLRKYGHTVDAFCDDSQGRYAFHFSEIGDPSKLDAMNFLQDKRSKRAFLEDKKWLDWAEACLLILPAGKSAHMEAGYVKGQNKSLVIWQDDFPKGEFDVMYGFADLISHSQNEVIEFFR